MLEMSSCATGELISRPLTKRCWHGLSRIRIGARACARGMREDAGG